MTTYPPGATFCRHCGYCLFGLPANVCPECGHGFDPADPATFLSRPRRRWLRRAIFRGVVGVLVLALAYGGFLTWLYVGWRAEAGARALATREVEWFTTHSILPAALPPLLIGDCRQWQERIDRLLVRQPVLSSNDIHAIVACRRLTGLSLFGVQLKTEDIVGLCQCEQLEELDLFSCELRTGDLAILGGLVHLKKLWLIDNRAMGDEDLAPVGKLKGLKELRLRATAVTDEGLAQLSELSDLQALHLSGCSNLTDAAVPHLSRLSGLKDLSPGDTKLTPAGIAQLKKNLPGCRVWAR